MEINSRFEREEIAWRRHERTIKDGASWYAYLYAKILMNRGCTRKNAIRLALERYPEARNYYQGAICERTASTNSPANAEPRSKPASAVQSVRIAGASYASTGVRNADSA